MSSNDTAAPAPASAPASAPAPAPTPASAPAPAPTHTCPTCGTDGHPNLIVSLFSNNRSDGGQCRGCFASEALHRERVRQERIDHPPADED